MEQQNFNDVKKCHDIAELNQFTRQWIQTHNLKGYAATQAMNDLLLTWLEQTIPAVISNYKNNKNPNPQEVT